MDDEVELRKRVYDHLCKTESAGDVYDLFSILGYPSGILQEKSSKRIKSSFGFKQEDEERIREVYSVLSFEGSLPVFLLETTTLSPQFIRSVTTTFDRQYLQFLLIFSQDYSELVFVFPQKEKVEVGNLKLKITKLIVDRKDLEVREDYYSVITTLAKLRYENEGWRRVWSHWREAFSVERVTKEFFENYRATFFKLRDEIRKQGIPGKESHEFALQFMNRTMFLYFLEKKGWLGNRKFISWLWMTYKVLGKYKTNWFYERWLKQVFLKAFNNRASEITDLPDEVMKVLYGAPYLNGGLFRENNLDELKVEMKDETFQQIFEFFESYNFTIREDMPLDSEVAVDPQMIGYVYESLANVADEIYDRNDLGIFYTPRVEVNFMCRRSLAEYLSKSFSREEMYHLLFDEDREKVEFRKWRELESALDSLTVIDPACGSGAFLVGMLNVLAGLYKLIYKNAGVRQSDFAIKNRIVQRSLYGVDVMPWAIHTAELRLWLQLVVETEFSSAELRAAPLLPNLNLNLRVGDSLIQEIGGITFNLRSNNLKPHLSRRIEELRDEKRKYFENSPTARFRSVDEVRDEELRIFGEIIDERISSLEMDLDTLSREGLQMQRTLTGRYHVDEEKAKERDARVEAVKNEIEDLKRIKKHLKDPEKKPFVWEIDFAEIFAGGGFDIVIGNPPYVRQEMISPPNRIKSEVTSEERKEYKEKLINSVMARFPQINKLDRQSDYYVYFYFHGLALLKKGGTFCFITSNSWLDVDYGKELQEFLCRYVPIIAIYDNPKRSFEHAAVNTIIALFGAPEIRDLTDWGAGVLKSTARFVMFKKPFEEVLSAENLIGIESARAVVRGDSITEFVKNLVNEEDYRVFPVVQEDLLEDGWEYPEGYKGPRFGSGRYAGNKWGGKYLRAPDIFYTILEKGKDKLVRLGDIAEVRRGFTTGVNEFFYLDDEAQRKWQIEKEFLKPVIKSPRECKSIIVDPAKLKFKVFMCSRPKSELSGTNALEYIEWGEKQTTEDGVPWPKVPSVNGRRLWYSLDGEEGNTFWVKETNDRLGVFVSNEDMICDCRLYFAKTEKILRNFLNSSLMGLLSEVLSRSGLGEGAKSLMVYEVNQFIVIPNIIGLNSRDYLRPRELRSIFEELGIDPSKPIREQDPKPLPDRKELDDIVFDELGLTKEERKEVYWSVCELVKQRLDKARSLKR